MSLQLDLLQPIYKGYRVKSIEIDCTVVLNFHAPVLPWFQTPYNPPFYSFCTLWFWYRLSWSIDDLHMNRSNYSQSELLFYFSLSFHPSSTFSTSSPNSLVNSSEMQLSWSWRQHHGTAAVPLCNPNCCLYTFSQDKSTEPTVLSLHTLEEIY